MVYHYESRTTSTNNGRTHTTTSFSVRELDDGEVGILMAGNNSIFDPSLTPRMLSVPTTDYDVESVAALSPRMEDDDDYDDDEEDFDDWFPSLRHLSWIHGLDDDDDDDDFMMDRMMETLFASAVMEQEEDISRSRAKRGHWHKKSKRESRTKAHDQDNERQGEEEEEDDSGMKEDDNVVSLVPIDVIYLRFND